MTILVTGGTGFIGSHLCYYLITSGRKVICLDNNSTGNIKNIFSIASHENFTYIEKDITEPFSIKDIIDLKNVYEIYHLACPASPKAYQEDPIKTLQTNFIGTMNVLDLAKQINAAVLLTSTSEIYGDPTISPQVETYWGNVNTIGPRSCYDEGKRVAETLMVEYNRKYNIPIQIARIFNTYGPQMNKDDGRVVSNFINQCLNNKDITIYGNGSQTRSFCYVKDTVKGLVALMDCDKYIEPVNIGNPNEITILKLAKIIKSMIHTSKSKIINEDLPVDDPKQRKPDINKAKKYLSWQPKVKLLDGLNLTIEYFKSLD
jgi:UDP-glucuronate decarboxylase